MDGVARRRGDGPSCSMFERADALLLGRKTWEIWEPYWPNHDDKRSATASTSCPSTCRRRRSRTRPGRTPTSSGDVEAAIRELKAQPGGELQVHGSGVLLRWLLERDLVDELNLRSRRSSWATGSGSSRSTARPTTWSWSSRGRRPAGVTILTYRRRSRDVRAHG